MDSIWREIDNVTAPSCYAHWKDSARPRYLGLRNWLKSWVSVTIKSLELRRELWLDTLAWEYCIWSTHVFAKLGYSVEEFYPFNVTFGSRALLDQNDLFYTPPTVSERYHDSVRALIAAMPLGEGQSNRGFIDERSLLDRWLRFRGHHLPEMELLDIWGYVKYRRCYRTRRW